jgi:hypothetical protein
MINTPMTVAASMPENTVMPMTLRASAPAPLAINNGSTPRINEKAVIRIGRKRSRAADSAASSAEKPSSDFSFANSTIRMAFLAAMPISITRPIWAKTLFW